MNYKVLFIILKVLLIVSWSGSALSVSFLLAMNVPEKTNVSQIVVFSSVFVTQLLLAISSVLYPVIFRLYDRQSTFSQYTPIVGGAASSLLSRTEDIENSSTRTNPSF